MGRYALIIKVHDRFRPAAGSDAYTATTFQVVDREGMGGFLR
jgi:hypothetical protein